MIKVLILGLALGGCAHREWPSRPQALGDKIVNNFPPSELAHFVGLKIAIAEKDHKSRAWIYENCEEKALYVWQNHNWLIAYSVYRALVNSGEWGNYKINPIGWSHSYEATDDDEEFTEELKENSIYWEEMEYLKDEECE